MHIWIVLAAFALAAVTPYLGVPSRTDVAQISEEVEELEQAADEADGERSA